MVVEPQDANPIDPSTIEGAIASSPEAVEEAREVTETATPQQAETPPVKEEQEETPLHEHPRFKEVVDEKNWWKEQYQQQQQRQQTPQPQPQDPDAGKTPEEKVFWQNVRQEAQKAVSPQIQAGVNEIARLRTTIFLKEHPDVKEGTPEYQQIAQKISQGYLPDDAYKAVFWDKKVETKRETNTAQQQQRLEAKKKANVVSPQSVNPAAVPPTKESFREEITRKMNDWDGTI